MTTRRPPETTRDGSRTIAERLIEQVKSGLWWTARFYGTIFVAGIVVQGLGLFESAFPSLATGFYALKVLVAIAAFVRLSQLLPDWLTERLDRVRVGRSGGSGWVRWYALYRVFR